MARELTEPVQPKPGAFEPSAGRWGTVELGVRLSELALGAAVEPASRQRVWTTGKNWFPDDHLRLSVEYESAAVTGGETPRRLQAAAAWGQLAF